MLMIMMIIIIIIISLILCDCRILKIKVIFLRFNFRCALSFSKATGKKRDVSEVAGKVSAISVSRLAIAGRSRDRIPVVTRFSALSQTGAGAQPGSYKMGNRALSRG
jgi:hypothetical protein